MERKHVNSKTIKRLESKKRKVEAFLELAKTIPENNAESKSLVLAKQPRLEDAAGTSDDRQFEANRDSDLKTDLARLRAKMKADRKVKMQKPKLYLTLDDLQVANKPLPSFALCPPASSEPRYLPLFLMDLQHLLLYAIQGNTASYKPRWCKLLRWTKVSHVIVLVLNEVSATEFKNYSDSFQFMTSTFQMKTEMISPSDYGSTVLAELFRVPLSFTEVKKNIRDLTWQEFKAQRKETRNVVSIEVDQVEDEKPEEKNVRNVSRAFSRLDLLLSPEQMMKEDFPLPFNVERSPGYSYSHENYTDVTAQSPLYAVDCEMCMTSQNTLELTRVSIIDENLEVVYDTLVKPYNRILNYLTRYSGITKAMLKDVTTRLENVQQTFQKILPPNAILCGQSLNNDLHALKMYHPYVIDTSVIYNLAGARHMKPGLKRLAAQFLGKDVQQGNKGHSPVEDATTTMELVLLKLKNGIHFGDVMLGGGAAFQSLQDKPSEEEKVDLALASTSIKKNDTKEVSNDGENDKRMEISCEGCKNCQKNQGTVDSSESESSDNEKGVCEQGCDTTKECSTVSCSVNTEETCLKVPRNKKKVFFERPGTLHSRHLCEIAKEYKRSMTLVGDCSEFQEALEWFYSVSDIRLESDSGVSQFTLLTATSDKSTAKQCKKSLCGSYLTLGVFNEFTPHCSDTEKQASLKKLDKRVKTVLKHAPSDALVAVVLGGHSDPVKSHPALCLVKVVP